MSVPERPASGLVSPEIWKANAPLEVFRRMIAGELPRSPISDHFDYGLAEIGEGRAVFESVPDERFYNPLGVVHGGFITTLLDSAMACAIHSTLPAGRGTTTIELKVNFIRPVVGNVGKLRAIGEVVNVGRQIGVAEGKLVGEDGKLYAHATTTCMNFDI